MLGRNESMLSKVNPALVGQPPISNEDQDLVSLPRQMNGLNIRKPTDHSEEYLWSESMTELLQMKISREQQRSENISAEKKRKRARNAELLT